MESSSDTSSTGNYSDGVYSIIKPEADAHPSYVVPNTEKPLPVVKPPMLPTVMLASLVLLFVFCFIGILVSGLHFGHRVPPGDCLGQSWVMFAVCIVLSHHWERSFYGMLHFISCTSAAAAASASARCWPVLSQINWLTGQANATLWTFEWLAN